MAGYDASGEWDDAQEEAWKKLTTVEKQYPVSILGLFQRFTDYITGNTTRYQDPEPQIVADDRTEFARTADRVLTNPHSPIGWMWQNGLPALGMATTVVNPLATVRVAAPTMLVGAGASLASDAASEALTGKTTEELAQPYVGEHLSFFANPGTYVGGKTAYNFLNLGRYTMDMLPPASYG